MAESTRYSVDKLKDIHDNIRITLPSQERVFYDINGGNAQGAPMRKFRKSVSQNTIQSRWIKWYDTQVPGDVLKDPTTNKDRVPADVINICPVYLGSLLFGTAKQMYQYQLVFDIVKYIREARDQGVTINVRFDDWSYGKSDKESLPAMFENVVPGKKVGVYVTSGEFEQFLNDSSLFILFEPENPFRKMLVECWLSNTKNTPRAIICAPSDTDVGADITNHDVKTWLSRSYGEPITFPTATQERVGQCALYVNKAIP
ncbi:hypothetical protein CC80DRAFT_532897 [Byssothecium circinans]|uniref:Uncharacterized protein n=1 Tax=Byssothecium circinans TaxID=147558 RepID=A0A6A5U5P7_9PLEO|nr:hypothetical protein CC80DRAFT_532897 [Byssothecium circinans]